MLFILIFKKETTKPLSNEERYGQAWLQIVGNNRVQGLQKMKELSDAGFVEGSIALAMFTQNPEARKALYKKAADAGNSEGLWGYAGFLPHSFYSDPDDEDDALWERYCIEAAERGSVDAMNEMGNVFHRRENYAESMYWYAMANAHDHRDGQISMVGIAREWNDNGCPDEFENCSKRFDEARYKCAMSYLEMNSDQEISIPPEEIVRMVFAGVPIAAYLAGDVFEGLGNYEMAYKMYNAISFENDPHGLRCLADMLFTGRGVEKDVESAIRMYTLAAEKGERVAMFIVGEFTKNTNKNLAAYWYGVSHSRGYEGSLQRLIQLSKQ